MRYKILALVAVLILVCLVIGASRVSSAADTFLQEAATASSGRQGVPTSAFLPVVLKPENLATSRRVNTPFADDGNIAMPRRTIFWFGRVDPTSNYADARIIYDDTSLHISLLVFDRQVWYDSSPTTSTLTEWDSATLLLDLDGNTGTVPDSNSHRFVAQVNNPPQPRQDYQAAYQGNGSGWATAATPFTSLAGFSSPSNSSDDRGWWLNFEIPFSSLGLAQRPSTGTIWGMAVAVHDRDTQAGGSSIPDQTWPEIADAFEPATWGQLHFGLPTYTPLPASAQGTTTIRHGLNGAVVVDAQVGGWFDCGEPFNPDFFNGWGDANHYNRPNRDQVNVQNQTNLGDWPCFSKTYITFPLDAIPPGKVIQSAALTLNHFGNSDPSQAQDSLIHVLTVGENWSETTITWNNAPLALENIAVLRVSPLPSFPGWPGIPQTWDVSAGVAAAYEDSGPLRLVLYSTDSQMHSGKYFYSSDADEAGRPMLTVEWSN